MKRSAIGQDAAAADPWGKLLPSHIIQHLLSFSDWQQLTRARSVCRAWKASPAADAVWKAEFLRCFDESNVPASEPAGKLGIRWATRFEDVWTRETNMRKGAAELKTVYFTKTKVDDMDYSPRLHEILVIRDKTWTLLDATSFRQLMTCPSPVTEVKGSHSSRPQLQCGASPDGARCLASLQGGSSPRVVICGADGKILHRFERPSADPDMDVQVFRLDYAPGRDLVALTVTQQRKIKSKFDNEEPAVHTGELWQASTGKRVSSATLPDAARCVSVHAGVWVTGNSSAPIRVCALESGRVLRQMPKGSGLMAFTAPEHSRRLLVLAQVSRQTISLLDLAASAPSTGTSAGAAASADSAGDSGGASSTSQLPTPLVLRSWPQSAFAERFDANFGGSLITNYSYDVFVIAVSPRWVACCRSVDPHELRLLHVLSDCRRSIPLAGTNIKWIFRIWFSRGSVLLAARNKDRDTMLVRVSFA